MASLTSATKVYTENVASAQKNVIENLRALTEIYLGHIRKEDHLLFPMANKVLSTEDRKNLGKKFEMVEKTMGTHVHERFERIVEKLWQKRWGW